MARIWKFSIKGKVVSYGTRERCRLSAVGCNEPYKDRFWCPKLQWFRKERCPFLNRRECENYEVMCGCL